MRHRRGRRSRWGGKRILGAVCIGAAVAVNVYPPLFGLVMETLLAALRGGLR